MKSRRETVGKTESKDKPRQKKTARIVEIPDHRPLNFEEFTELKEHAYNSALWNVTHYPRTVRQVKDKLYSKGYVEEDVIFVNYDGEESSFNIVNDVIDRLMYEEYLNDEVYTGRFIESKLSQGWGLSRIRMELSRKGVSKDVVNLVVEENDYTGDVLAALRREAERVLNTSVVKNEVNLFKKRQRVTQSLARKGFSFSDIKEVLEEFEEM